MEKTIGIEQQGKLTTDNKIVLIKIQLWIMFLKDCVYSSALCSIENKLFIKFQAAKSLQIF